MLPCQEDLFLVVVFIALYIGAYFFSPIQIIFEALLLHFVEEEGMEA